MTYYYKIIEDNKLIMIGTQSFEPVEGQIGITEYEYNSILQEMQQRTEEIQTYVDQLLSGEIQYSQIPEEYREEVGNISAPQFAEKVYNKEITIDNVPSELQSKVQEILSAYPSNPYGISDELCNQIKQDTIDEIVAEVNM